jgi:hypothetical protein
MYGEKLDLPIKIGDIPDSESYYQSLHGSQLLVKVLDNENNLVARGMGVSWNETYQMTPVMEWGQRHAVEIVKGAMQPGQIQVQSMYFMKLNDTLPTYKNLASKRELKVIIQIADHEDDSLKGVVLDVFEGCVIQAQSGNWNSQSLYMRNANILYRKRLKGIEWVKANQSAKYPAKAGDSITFDSTNPNQIGS